MANMWKRVLTCTLGVILLSGCGSHDKPKVDDKDTFQPNSQLQVVPPSRVSVIQQQQEFPSRQRAVAPQYAQVETTTALPPSQMTVSDTDDDFGASGMSLPAITGQPTVIESETVSTVTAPDRNTSVQPSSANPTPAASVVVRPEIPPASNPVIATQPAVTPVSPPATAMQPADQLTHTVTVTQPAAVSDTTSPSPLSTVVQSTVSNTGSAVSTTTTVQPVAMPDAQPDNPAVMSNVPTPDALQTTVRPDNTLVNPAVQAQTHPQPQSQSQPQAVPTQTTTTTTSTWQSLAPAPSPQQAPAAQPVVNDYSSFENVAIPVTFNTSPDNRALQSFTVSTPAASTDSSGSAP